MAVSTERTVRDVLVGAIRGVADQLGFAEPNGNVKDYPIEWHQDEQLEGYLRAKVGSVFVPRAWAVDVQGYEAPLAVGGIFTRTYVVQITGYYAKGIDGTSYKELVDHARVIRGAVQGLPPRWADTVSIIDSVASLSVSEAVFSSGRMLVGRFGYVANKRNADY